MNVRDLIHWGRETDQTPTAYRSGTPSPFLSLHRDMNRLFDEAFRDFGAPGLFGRTPAWPSVEVTETEKDVRIAAELPGLEEKDVEVLIEDGVLTLRGVEKPVVLPFTLKIDGDTATMTGATTIDRRDFGIGTTSYGDEKTVAFAVAVDVALTAKLTAP